MPLETEIKTLAAAVSRLADGVEKLLSHGAAPAFISGATDKAPPQVQTPTPAEAVAAIPADTKSAEVKPLALEDKPLALEDIKKAMMAMSTKFPIADGVGKSKEILSRYGAVKLSQVPERCYAEFIALCDSVAAGGDA